VNTVKLTDEQAATLRGMCSSRSKTTKRSYRMRRAMTSRRSAGASWKGCTSCSASSESRRHP
jgi:hypothetical protein